VRLLLRSLVLQLLLLFLLLLLMFQLLLQQMRRRELRSARFEGVPPRLCLCARGPGPGSLYSHDCPFLSLSLEIGRSNSI
jgi:hypothetical protein